MTPGTIPPLQPARRLAGIEPFHVMEMMALAAQRERQGLPVLHLEVGEPDFTTAAPIIDAGIEALQQGDTHYTLATGRPELKQAIADWYANRYSTTIERQRIVITVGASGALQMVLWTLINPGDEVLLADPGYPCNQNFVRLADGVPRLLRTRPEQEWKITPQLVEAQLTDKTRALLIATPNNPTGTVMSGRELEAIATLCSRHGIALIVDEIYAGLIYDQPDFSACQLGNGVFVINSFSKYFGMTGWRLGWVVCPENFVRPLEKLAQNLFISPPTVAQQAALSAFSNQSIAILEQRKSEFRERRDYLMAELPALGFEIPHQPAGAFYLFAGIGGFGMQAEPFCRYLLEQAGVAITPGIDFSSAHAHDHVRFAYTIEMEKLQQAVENMRAALINLR